MKRPLLTPAQIRAIADHYDGSTETIDRLVRKYGTKRHNIIQAAIRGGYKSRRKRVTWTRDKDKYLADNWGKAKPEDICAHLGCSFISARLRSKRIGVSTRNNADLTVYDLEQLTKLDHRRWRRFIDSGWLKAYKEWQRDRAVHSRRVTIDNLHRFLREHPEVFNYRAADRYVCGVLELDRLPPPPGFMRVTCRSDHWQDRVRQVPTGFKIHHGDVELRAPLNHYSLKSCAETGALTFGPRCTARRNAPAAAAKSPDSAIARCSRTRTPVMGIT